jgi:hypothetical protein
VFGGNKPLPCLYQHEPQQGLTPNNLSRISLIVGANLLEPPFRVGVYLSQIPSMTLLLRPVHLESGELTAHVTLLSPLASRIAHSIIADYVIYL